MSTFREFKDLLGDIGSEFGTFGRELRAIGTSAAEEFRAAPVKYIRDSARDLTRMGVHHPALEAIGGESRPLPGRMLPRVVPVEGSVLYTDLLGEYAQHSGIYIGNGQIVELSGKGRIQLVNRKKFISGGTGADIYVSCRRNRAVGSALVAQRARQKLGIRRSYNFVFDNCHQFCAGCLDGDFENSDNFLWMLKSSTEKFLDADGWNIWRC